jgi:hypothetical protein
MPNTAIEAAATHIRKFLLIFGIHLRGNGEKDHQHEQSSEHDENKLIEPWDIESHDHEQGIGKKPQQEEDN